MTGSMSRELPPLIAGRLAAAISVVALVAMVGLVNAGPVLGAPPTPPPTGPTPTLNPGQAKKATPTPPPAPPPAPTPAPTPAPAATATPAPAVTSGPPASTGSTVTPTPRPGASGATSSAAPSGGPASSPSPAGGGVLATPDSTGTDPGSIASGGSATGDGTPLAALLIAALTGILMIVCGWFIAGRRSARDEETPDDASAGSGGTGGDTEPLAGPEGPPATIAYWGARFEDPLVAAMARSHARTAGRPTRTAAAPPPLEPHDSTFSGPTWVNRLDPRIRVEPTMKSQPDRVKRGAKGGETGGMPEVDAAPNLA
jgi:hypothetical protein